MAISLDDHFDALYGSSSSIRNAFYQLLPRELADPQVFDLRSTGFLCSSGLIRWQRRLEGLSKKVGHLKGSYLLDAGCGLGRLGDQLARVVGAFYVGVDRSSSALRLAKEGNPSNCVFVQADVSRLPLRAAAVDVTLSLDSFHLVSDPVAALMEARRTLRRDGVLLASTYRIARRGAIPRDAGWWQSSLRCCGFTLHRWEDVTSEWRTHTRSKHARRWEHRKELIDAFGAEAVAECEVSRLMLGIGEPTGFIDVNSRWEFVAVAM